MAIERVYEREISSEHLYLQTQAPTNKNRIQIVKKFIEKHRACLQGICMCGCYLVHVHHGVVHWL